MPETRTHTTPDAARHPVRPGPDDGALSQGRLIGISVLTGAAAVLSGLRDRVDLWVGLAGIGIALLLVALLLRGVRFRVDQDRARGQVFYSGEGAAGWFLVTWAGVLLLPALVAGLITDSTGQLIALLVLGAAIAVTTHRILSARATLAPQPSPDPVPLGRPQD